jgi:predicted amidohydrolase
VAERQDGAAGGLRVALVQMRCEKGAVDQNLAAMAGYLAAARGADVVCFPEASITGYVEPARFPRAVLRLDGPEVARFVALTRDSPATALAGLVEANGAASPYIT